MLLRELFDYKNLIMKSLCSNADIVKLLTGKNDIVVPAHDLPYTQLYPFEFIPDTADDSRTYICFDVDIAKVPSKTFYDPVLYIWIVVHKSQMRLPEGGVRMDELASAIDEEFNRSRYFGLGELQLSAVKRFTPLVDFLGRTLVYKAKDFNNPGPPRRIPSNRKAGV